ncbi:MAG: hypothetical protein MK202_13190 [Tenacibaculum sp.]|nr:hypothetical protein [Tenacibaculum sp.]
MKKVIIIFLAVFTSLSLTAQNLSIKKTRKTTMTSSNKFKKSKNYTGTYRVTFTNVYGSSKAEYFGTAGVYLESQSKSGAVQIRPMNKKPNRIIDVSKNRPFVKRDYKKTKKYHFIRPNGKQESKTTRFETKYTVDRIREFKLAGEAANKKATFDFQFNLKRKFSIVKDIGKWERVKINIDDLVLGREYVFLSGTSNFGISFKVEKK